MAKIVKNKLEKLISKNLHAEKGIWFIKLHNNLLAHQKTPADYLLQTTISGRLHSFLLEAKQVTCEPEENGRLAFKRLTQLHPMLIYNTFSIWTESYFIIGFLESQLRKSEIYLIPAEEMNQYIEKSTLQSINRKTCKEVFSKYSILDKGVLNIKSVLVKED